MKPEAKKKATEDFGSAIRFSSDYFTGTYTNQNNNNQSGNSNTL